VEHHSTAPMYAPDILPLLQSLLKTLADIAFEHEREVERIVESELPKAAKQDRLRKLDERYRERRAPYEAEIARLHEQVSETLRRAA
jgi:hypothetical protein